MTERRSIFFDTLFRQKRKHGKWRIIEAPKLEAPVADTHAHLQILPDPALALARAATHGVAFICTIVDISEDGTLTFEKLEEWRGQAGINLGLLAEEGAEAVPAVPKVRIAVGCHPHNARLYDEALEARLVDCLHDGRVSAVGEVGLDYHYDFSPRDVQQEVFRRQIRVAKMAGVPLILHLREAHDDGFAILQEQGFPEAGVLLHCYSLDSHELIRWLRAGCYIAFGGALTFKKSDDVREAARKVPLDRLLTETDAPYMTPEPLRGTPCGPENVIFTADMLANLLAAGGMSRAEILNQLYANAIGLLDRMPTLWQMGRDTSCTDSSW